MADDWNEYREWLARHEAMDLARRLIEAREWELVTGAVGSERDSYEANRLIVQSGCRPPEVNDG